MTESDDVELSSLLGVADPTGGRRWILPVWGTSLVLHLSLIALLMTTVAIGPRENLPAEQTMDVGIVPKTVKPRGDIYENPEQRFEEPDPKSTLLDPELDVVVQEMFAEEPAEPLLDLDPALLATAGQTQRDAGQLLSIPSVPAGKPEAFGKFLGVPAVGKSFVYVIDRSASMSYHGAIELVKRKILQSISQLDSNQSFQIIFYNSEFRTMPRGAGRLIKATDSNIDFVRKFLDGVVANGGTRHNPALLHAFEMEPEVIWFLTDADMMTEEDVRLLSSANRRRGHSATIHTFEFAHGSLEDDEKPLRKLARQNHGTYKHLNLLKP